jgi:hypothetical protein
MMELRRISLLLTLLVVVPTTSFVLSPGGGRNQRTLGSSKLYSTTPSSASLVVVSPPGGVGEVAAVKAASMGSNVRWFVVSQKDQDVQLSQTALDEIAQAGGSIQLAGANFDSLLLTADDPSSALPAVSTWCGTADTLLCTCDGIPENPSKRKRDDPDVKELWTSAMKVAAKEAAKSVRGIKIAILPTEEGQKTEGEEEGGIGSLVGGLLGRGKVDIPANLAQAMSNDSIFLRHGALFGTPESSPDFSALLGGPRKVPELCEEYTMRSVSCLLMLIREFNMPCSPCFSRQCNKRFVWILPYRFRVITCRREVLALAAIQLEKQLRSWR